jgi:shikimate kinase
VEVHIARNLAASAATAFVDLDQYNEDKSALSIKAIFLSSTEIKFRKWNTKSRLWELIAIRFQSSLVEEPCYANNHELF